jgi:hypothetical protein
LTGRVYSRLADTNVLTEARLGLAGWVDGGLDTNLFTVGRLEAGSVFTFTRVDLSLVLLTAARVDLDVYLSVVLGAVVWKKVGEMGSVLREEVREVWSMNVRNFDVNVGG